MSVSTGNIADEQYEFLFKGHHVIHLPFSIRSSYSFSLKETSELSHVTHNYAADEITQGDYFVFKPRQKKGKGLESERYTYVIENPADSLAPNKDTKCFQQDGVLLPGSYIWWSPSNENPNSSVFGNNKFTINLTKLLQCYQQAIKGDSNITPNIHFRCGGTLRYDRQACKVIIVCPVDCPELDKDKESFPPGIGLGDLTQREITPTLRYENLPPILKECTHDWHDIPVEHHKVSDRVTYAFALYFPDNSYELKCHKDIVTRRIVAHGKFCVGKEKNPSTRRYECPNSFKNPEVMKPKVVLVSTTTEEENETEEPKPNQLLAIKRKHSPVDNGDSEDEASSPKRKALEEEETEGDAKQDIESTN